MTPVEAMAAALDIVERLSKGAATPQTLDARVSALLDVATWLYDGDDGDDGGSPTGTPAPVPGATRAVHCAVDPGDGLTVRGGPGGRLGPVVRVTAHTATGTTVTVVLTPADARRLAAGMLDAADEADGTAPLSVPVPDAP